MSTSPRRIVGKAATALLPITLGAVVLYLGLPRTISVFALERDDLGDDLRRFLRGRV